MARWKLKEEIALPESLKSLSLPLAIKKLLAFRGIMTRSQAEVFLLADYERDMHSPFLFSQMEKVVERIEDAKKNGERVAIFGDYDADGITSSVILKETLTELGIESFVYIPDKKLEGYGLNQKAILQFKEKNVKLIITVDCGITGIAEIKKASELGIDVIITDHHHIPNNIPQAFAIINSHMQDSGYPFSDLAGVGVAFKVVQAIYERLMPEKKEMTKWMLDLVAIGTIADCVPLLEENRIMVKYGLLVLAKTRRLGLKELFTVGRIVIDENNIPDTRKISFHVAPRINAAGRIKHANLAYDLIVETDPSKARVLALELEANNGQRQKITEQVTKEVKILALNSFKNKKFIFAEGEHFPIGVVGLVAGKIAQEFNKPTVIFQKEARVSKGSFRSIPQLNIIETIEKCKEFVLKFGGHAQAAGVSVENVKMKNFYEAMNALIEKELTGKDLSPKIMIDLKLMPSEIDFEILDSLEKLRPFGEGNPEPVFMMEKLIITALKTVGNGNKHTKMSLRPQDGTVKNFEGILFNSTEKIRGIESGAEIDVVFSLQKDQWNGNNRIQFIIEDIALSENKSSKEQKIA